MNANYTLVTDVEHQLAAQPDSTVSRTLYQDERLKAVLFSFSAGQELSEHTASMPAVMHFLSGEADVTLGPDRVAAGPGTWIHMPAQLPHAISCKTPVVMLLSLLKTG